MNIKPLILCFFAATIFWLLDTLSRGGYTTRIDYPIEFEYDHQSFIPTKTLPQNITINLTSTGWDLLKKSLKFNQSPLVLKINNPLTIKQLDATSFKSTIIAQFPQTQINHIESENLELHFDKKISKVFALKVDSLNIDLADGFSVSSLINISPNSIQIEGPESELKKLGNTLYLPIKTKRLATNFDEKVNINLPENSIVKSLQNKASVSFEVAELLNK